MNAWEAIVLGLVQGLTEFLPISSSAHLRIVGELIGSSDPGAAFTAITQIGTETAVIIYFRKDIARICRAWWQAMRSASSWGERFKPADPDARMGWWIALGSVPIVVLGLLFEDAIDSTFRNLYLTVATLAIFAIFLGWADRVGARRRPLEDTTAKRALALGFAQAMALVPGVSRSGGTITIALLLGYTREAAARYSFLLAIPAVMGSGLYKLAGSLGEFGEAGTPSLGATMLATLIAFGVGYVVIIAFLRIVSTFSYRPFVLYRLGLAAVVLVLLTTGVLQATGGTPVG